MLESRAAYTVEYVFTLSNKGSKRVLPNQSHLLLKNPFLTKGFFWGFVRLRVLSKNPLGRKSSSKIVERSSPSNIQMFTDVSNGILECRRIWSPLNQCILLVFWHRRFQFPSFPAIQFHVNGQNSIIGNLEPSFCSQPYCIIEIIKAVVVVIQQDLHPLKT